MTTFDRDPVRELVERAREIRRSEQPRPELFATALGRLAREELSRERSGIFTVSRALNGVGRWLLRLGAVRLDAVRLGAVRLGAVRLGPVRLGLALALALTVLVSWGARRYTALDPHQHMPNVALAPEPALPAAPGPAPLPPVSNPSGAAGGAARSQNSGEEPKAAGSWTVMAWDEGLRPRPPALRQMPDHRQCIDVTGNQRLTLGSQGGPGRRGFELVQGQRYRLILPRLSLTGPELKLTAFVGSSASGHEPPLLTNLVSTPSPSTLGISFQPHRDDARAPVGLVVDATGSFGTSELCLGTPRVELLPEQTEDDAVAESYELGEGKPSTDESAGRKKEDGKKERKPARPLEPSCNPPWYFDAHGIKRLKSNCL